MLQFACERLADPAAMTCDCDLPAGITAADIVDIASDVVALLSDGVITGRCTALLRPVADGAWCGIHGDVEPYIVLPGPNPVVNHVKIDGATLPASDYKVVDGVKLYRVVGRWPTNQNFLLPSSAANTFEVSVTTGFAPSLIVRNAVLQVACEIAQNVAGARANLPANAIAATMDGVTVDLEALAGVLGNQSAMKQLLETYGYRKGYTEIASPELRGGWVLHW